MYQGCSIVNVEPCYCESKITVTTNFDIDPASVHDGTVQLFSKHDETNVNIELSVDRKNITIHVKSEIVPNTDYILRVFKIKGLLGEDLTAGIRRKVIFTSEIKDTPSILSPSNFEEVKNLKVTLATSKEGNASKQLEDKLYYIQIATDVAFYDIVMETKTEKNETDLKDLPAGQYYIRARIEKSYTDNRDFGKWSETVTFISLNFGLNNPEEEPDDTEPEYIEYVSVLNSPANGETPDSIIIEFSENIDPDSIEDILVIRRDI